jgi:putative FmdB family regulatory protein
MFYIYHGEDCDHEEEKIHGMNEEPTYNCPKCGAIMKRMIFGGSGVIYKGVGWPRKNTGLDPKMTRSVIKELKGPKFLKKCIKN